METLYGFDTSRWQGTITQSDIIAALGSGKSFWYFKGSGGDDGLYVDSQFEASLALARMYPQLKRGVYHFAGMGDPTEEANYAVDNVWNKLQAGEVPILDIDSAAPNDPVWAATFLAVADARMGIPVPIYMNQSTENSFDWKGSGLTNRSLIIADYAVSPEGTVALKNWPFYFGQQYSSVGKVGNLSPVDLDAIFVDSIDAWDKIAVQVSAPALSPTPVTPQIIQPTLPVVPVSSTVPPTTGSSVSVLTPQPVPTTTSSTGNTSTSPKAVDIVKPVRSSKPLLIPSTNEATVVESGVKEFILSNYNKALVAVVGAVLNFSTLHYGANHMVTYAVAVATALGVYQVSNSGSKK